MKWFIGAGLFLVLTTITWWLFTPGSEIFSPAVLTRLKPGMTTNQVIVILGHPSSVDNIHPDYIQWVYSHWYSINVGVVNFDKAGRLTQALND